MPGPLDGVKVVEVAIWWFVPAAGAILADWGAEVIKVEHPETGDPQRALFTSGLVPDTGGVNFMMEQSNRGKKSIGIDLATDGGRDVLYDLVKDADVFLTNFLGPARRRLLDLGIVPGAQIEAEYASPGGDPVAYRVREALIALRRTQAELIQVVADAPVGAGR